MGANYKGFRIVGTNQITSPIGAELGRVASGASPRSGAGREVRCAAAWRSRRVIGAHGMSGAGEHSTTSIHRSWRAQTTGTVIDRIVLTDVTKPWEGHADQYKTRI